jgi:anthranilate synthase/aminodeoxychorismate synthase-like glutamine amidotransferase
VPIGAASAPRGLRKTTPERNRGQLPLAARHRNWSSWGVILVLDNRDSFTFNLVQALRTGGAVVRVERAAKINVTDIEGLRPERILIGPGPGTPEAAGCSLDVVRERPCSAPILGVCLGMQAVAAALGARIVRAHEPVHGHAESIEHDGRGLFRGLPRPLTVGRYHSLIVEESSLPAELEVTARASSGEVMAIRHRSLPIEAVQFHPESILSEACEAFFENFRELGSQTT